MTHDEQLWTRFQSWGESVRDSSPLYAGLATRIADDAALVELAQHVRAGQPVPNMLFASVHYLLMQGADAELADYYPTLTATPRNDDPFPAFRAFCLTHRNDIISLLKTRIVQTNEVRRCASLVPAFTTVWETGTRKPLALVEVGPSAGLNLLWDQYFYEYSDGQTFGNPQAAVRLTSEVRGAVAPPIPDTAPTVVSRAGVDLNPVDVTDADAVLWLRALVFPDNPARLAQLDTALGVARRTPPTLVTGDALDRLPALLAQAPTDATLCVFHTFVLNQFSREAREQLYMSMQTHSQTRDVFVIGIEWLGTPTPHLELTSFHKGRRESQLLARCDHHGRWLEWLVSRG